MEVPQPLYLALAEMRQPPRWQLVFLVPNLDSFQHYIAYYATEAEIEELLHLPVVYHRGTWSGNATPFPIGVMVGDRFVQFPETLCTAAACWLCQEGRSGYSFCWVDEPWTPQAAIDLMLSLQEMRGGAQAVALRHLAGAATRCCAGPVPLFGEGRAAWRLGTMSLAAFRETSMFTRLPAYTCEQQNIILGTHACECIRKKI